MEFKNRIVEYPDKFKILKEDGTEETVRIIRDGGRVIQEGSQLNPKFFSEKANSVGIDMTVKDISASKGRVYYLGKTVSGVLSGDVSAVLTNCEGEITLSGTMAKVFINNCPYLKVKGLNDDNFFNAYIDGYIYWKLQTVQNQTVPTVDTLITEKLNFDNVDEIIFDFYSAALAGGYFRHVISKQYKSANRVYFDKNHNGFLYIGWHGNRIEMRNRVDEGVNESPEIKLLGITARKCRKI